MLPRGHPGGYAAREYSPALPTREFRCQCPPLASQWFIAAFLLIVSPACAPDTTTQPIDGALQPAFSTATCNPLPLSGTTRPWGCGETVRLLYEEGQQEVSNAVDGAITRWNDALAAERGYAVPRFTRISQAVTDTSGQRLTVRVIRNGNGSLWCDATNVTGAGKAINLYPAGAPCDGNAGSLNAVMLHALGHALGLSSFPMHTIGVKGVSNHCSIYLPSAGRGDPNPGSLNETLCQHEIDIVLMIYGAYPQDYPGDPAAFWGKHILSRTGLPDSLRLRADETRVLNSSGPYFANGQTLPSVSSLSLSWTTDADQVATVEAGNVVKPRSPGFARLRAVVRAVGFPANVRRSVRLREGSTGHQIDATVTPAVWVPGFRVTDILGPVAPLTGGQPYSFTTTVVNSGGYENLRVTWRLIKSNAPADTQVVANTANYLSTFVPAGSYSLRVIAVPRDIASGNTGGAFVRDYPVCTGQVLFGGGASTNAPQGCGTPPIQ